MPLSIQSKPASANVLDELDAFLEKYGDFFAHTAQKLKDTSVCLVAKDQACLFIGQREIGSTGVFDENIKMLGTDMMTTCHAAVLRCPVTGATSLGHFDGSSTKTGILEMILAVHSISLVTNPELANCQERQLELHLVGGFNDDRQLSEDLSISLLNEFHRLEVEFCSQLQIHLQTFCCSSMNTTTVACENDLIESPVIFGLGVNISSGHLFPLVFHENARQPGKVIRGVRTFHGHAKMVNMYRWETNTVVIKPFTYEPFPNAAKWLELPDSIIKEHMSTSPEVEPPDFVAHIRDSLQYILCNPDPLVSIFSERKPLQYEITNKEWKKITS
uniref:Protein N-terminal asparagine amidohydrolase n=1 Tax=Phallusia mammillata TaxID=59560 RepID=A0A6F9DNB4_9ASCI|nr:protein N-terminal asparagine amidohydrolase [Phallusia mammillata]